jgi:CheY-like chemotaxis protein
VKHTVTDALKIMEAKARIKGLELRSRIDDQIPATVMGDQLRLSQILFNLMGNAVKFTDSGYVEVNARLVSGPDETKHFIAFTVKDTGIGVPAEKQAIIFERFTQANTDTERLYGGTGLGLNIAKGIVDMHGGTLKMESTPGKGTIFHFILPFGKFEGESAETEPAGPRNRMVLETGEVVSVLLAEDNAINAMLAKQVLEKGGFIVSHVTNGMDALELLQKETFDVILMDIQMPVMNGITATEKIRALSGPAASIPVVAMTAHSLYGEMQSCYNAGMNGYVSKPFKTDTLFAAILDAIRSTRPSSKENVNGNPVSE